MPITENSSEQAYFSKLEPKSHFFTELDVFTQDIEQAFGPVNGKETSQFRVTSKFSITKNFKAFAVCKGIVFIQPQEKSTDKVNLILRPYKQPIQGINIKYFVYRGLDINDFFSGEQVISADGNNTSDLINKVNEEFIAFHGESVPVFLSKFIGYDPPNQDGELMIDSFFFKKSTYTDVGGTMVEDEQTAFELPLIDIGKSLGHFVTGDCGFDIVLSYGDYALPQPNHEFLFNLAYARATEAVIDIDTEPDDFRKKLKREQVYQFLDAAAYYGFHHCEKGIVVTDDGGGKKAEQKLIDIYNNVLNGFITKNRLYLYIVSDRNRSYNFYNTYYEDPSNTVSLRTGVLESSLASALYETYGWPLIIETSSQSSGEEFNSFFVQMPIEHSCKSVFYAVTGNVMNATKNNFMVADNLLPEDVLSEIYCRPIHLTYPSFFDGTDNKNIAYPILCFYKGRNLFIENTNAIPSKAKQIDEIFSLINALQILPTDNETSLSIITKSSIHALNLSEVPLFGLSAISLNMFRIQDVVGEVQNNQFMKRTTFLSKAAEVLNDNSSVNTSISYATGSASNSVSKINEPVNSFLSIIRSSTLSIGAITDSTNTITTLRIVMEDGAISSTFFLGITDEEHAGFTSIIATEMVTNPQFMFEDYEVGNSKFLSFEGVEYFKYKLAISGENTTGIVKQYYSANEIIVYSLDGLVFFSADYGSSLLMPLIDSEILEKKIIL